MHEDRRHRSREGGHEAAAPEPRFRVIAPLGIRGSVAVPMPGETEAERRRRDEVFHAVLDAAGRP